MTTIRIDDHVADALNAQATALGMTLEDYLRSLAQTTPGRVFSACDLPSDSWSAQLHTWAAGFPPCDRLADDHRESLYSERGE